MTASFTAQQMGAILEGAPPRFPRTEAVNSLRLDCRR
jgi:hypothetical protein